MALSSVQGRSPSVREAPPRPDLFREMNEAYSEFFPTNRPARSVAQLGATLPGVMISIEAIALA